MRRVLKEKCSIISLCLSRAYGEVRVFTSHDMFHILIKFLDSKLLPVNYSLLILSVLIKSGYGIGLVQTFGDKGSSLLPSSVHYFSLTS